MGVDVERIVSSYLSSARYNPTYRHKRRLQHFPAASSLKFNAMEILGSFPVVARRKQYIPTISGC